MSIATLINKLVRDRADSTIIQIIRYGVTSAVGLGVDFAVLYVLTELAGVHYLLSAVGAYMVGLVVNYAMSVLWVFAVRRLASRTLELGVFVSIGIAGMGLNELLLWLLASVIGIHYILARAVSAVVGFVWKFFVRKMVLFR